MADNSGKTSESLLKPKTLALNALFDGIAGAAAGFMADFLLYGVDSYKVMMQSGSEIKVNRLFRGVLPVALLGSVPSFGVFFCLYSPTKATLEHVAVSNGYNNGEMSAFSIVAASIIGGVPSSVVAVPADIIKKKILQQQSTTGRDVIRMIRNLLCGGNSMFNGWRVNLSRDLSFVTVKMTLYELMCKYYIVHFRGMLDVTLSGNAETNKDMVTQRESALLGCASGAVTGLVTCPLDVVNTRLKNGDFASVKNRGIYHIMMLIGRTEGVSVLFSGVTPRIAIISLGSTAFWYLYAAFRNVLQH